MPENEARDSKGNNCRDPKDQIAQNDFFQGKSTVDIIPKQVEYSNWDK